jgi:hypothetical protein
MSDHTPGSVLHHAQTAAEAYAPGETTADYAVPPPVEEKYVVQVREQRAAHVTYRTLAIGAQAKRRLLGRNPLRRSVTITCVSGTAVVCNTGDMADAVVAQNITATPTSDVAGFYLPSGTPGVTLPNACVEGVFGVAVVTGAALVAIAEEWWDE